MSAERRNVPAVVEAAVPVKASRVRSTIAVPAVIAGAGDHAARRFLEFFAAQIRNKNTRMAYYRAVCHFFGWIEHHRIGELADIEPVHVAPISRCCRRRRPSRRSSSTSLLSACCSIG